MMNLMHAQTFTKGDCLFVKLANSQVVAAEYVEPAEGIPGHRVTARLAHSIKVDMLMVSDPPFLSGICQFVGKAEVTTCKQ